VKAPRQSKSSSRGKKTQLANPTQPRPSSDEVARRAYELFLERGGRHGDDWQDWLTAERQLSSLES